MDYAPHVSLGVYVHIPYCLQRCPYCDFATYEVSRIPGPELYLELVLAEIKLRTPAVHGEVIDTLYFGGGTPSLLPPDHLLRIKEALREHLSWSSTAEITLEINPATLDPVKIETLVKGGFNRFSVGAQTFNDRLLKGAGRKHTAQDTIDTLHLLRSFDLNYSFDLLFALPEQSLDDLKRDLDSVAHFLPRHVSPYCLTVPESNPMSKNRPLEAVQIEMFHLIDRGLRAQGLARYEISNYARPGYESRHNLLYWQDRSYLGLGLSAHSYLTGAQLRPGAGPTAKRARAWGTRFWNPSQYSSYEKQVRSEIERGAPENVFSHLPADHQEHLSRHESLTDFCHTSLRLTAGLHVAELARKFGPDAVNQVQARLSVPAVRDLVDRDGTRFWLNDRGWILSNRVFQEVTFLAAEAGVEDAEADSSPDESTFERRT